MEMSKSVWEKSNFLLGLAHHHLKLVGTNRGPGQPTLGVVF